MEGLEASLAVYEEQLKQVEATLLATSSLAPDEELVSLKNDLKQLIDLSKQNLLELKKKELLEQVEEVERNQVGVLASSSHQDQKNEDAQNASDCVEVVDDMVSSLVGNKCLAPFRTNNQDQSHHTFHNAIIFSADQDPCGQVRVTCVYSHPTQVSMVPCKFYMEGACKFSDDKCKYSHGQVHDFLDVREFREPDYAQVKANVEGTALLALDESSPPALWKHASLVQYEDDQKVHVKFIQTSNIASLSLDQVLPLSDDGSEDLDDDDDEDFAPVDLAMSSARLGSLCTSALGGWESSTRGIGSKLMAAMGYVHGTGLGTSGQGLVEPVPVVVYPSGKSLDWCMEAKTKAKSNNESNRTGVVYLDKKRKMQMDAQAKTAAKEPKSKSDDVFDIINKRLSGGVGSSGSGADAGLKLSKDLAQRPCSSASADSKEEDKRRLNMENLKTMEKLQRNQREIDKVESSLKRARDKGDRSLLGQKLARLKGQRDQLRTHERNVESSLSQRSKKKLEIF